MIEGIILQLAVISYNHKVMLSDTLGPCATHTKLFQFFDACSQQYDIM